MLNISPRIDMVFKKIFGVEENKDILISLINSIVCESDQVADLELLNPYNFKNFVKDKLSILDIKARGKDGKRFNIEIQVTDEADYDKRALYYWAKLYTEQLKSGEDYGILSKAIGIHILNFTSIVESNKYHNVFHIKEKESGLEYFKDLELHTIELKKFSGSTSQKLSDLMSKINTSLDIWVAFLTRHDLFNKDDLPETVNQMQLQKALTVLEVMSFNAEEREAYEGALKWFQVEANTLKKAEARGEERGEARGIEIGEARGIEIGEARGIEIGEAQGIEIGKTQMANNLAISLIKEGCDLDLICKVTGFSISQVKALAKETQRHKEFSNNS